MSLFKHRGLGDFRFRCLFSGSTVFLNGYSFFTGSEAAILSASSPVSF